jgi:hypothetical protein
MPLGEVSTGAVTHKMSTGLPQHGLLQHKKSPNMITEGILGPRTPVTRNKGSRLLACVIKRNNSVNTARN